MSENEKPIEERIRERAYALWEKDGRPEGQSEYYWHQARSEIEDGDAEPGIEEDKPQARAARRANATSGKRRSHN